MSDLSIKIKIGEREYPMRVKPEDEAKVRLAGKMVNEKMRNYHNQFGIDDKQDLLAMVAFDALVEKLSAEENEVVITSNFVNQIDEISEIIDDRVNTFPTPE